MKLCTIGLAAVLQLAAAATGFAADPIKIGDINSYSAIPAFTVPYRNGATLAIEEINASGGVLGRPLELVSRDDNGKPEDALRNANDLVFNEKVVALSGTFFSNVGLARLRFCQDQQDSLRGCRSAQRCAHLAKGQPLHIPRTLKHLHAGGHVGR